MEFFNLPLSGSARQIAHGKVTKTGVSSKSPSVLKLNSAIYRAHLSGPNFSDLRFLVNLVNLVTAYTWLKPNFMINSISLILIPTIFRTGCFGQITKDKALVQNVFWIAWVYTSQGMVRWWIAGYRCSEINQTPMFFLQSALCESINTSLNI